MKTLRDTSHPDLHAVERKARTIIAGIFILTFMASLGYWGYTVYDIYDKNFRTMSSGEVWYYMGRNLVAFQAALLSIALIYVVLKA
jgi:hypothetical protein